MRLTVSGCLFGLAGGLAATRILSSMLYGVKPNDSLTFTLVLILLSAVALLACAGAARRATAVDPNVALKCE